jgi:hypothetical protein
MKIDFGVERKIELLNDDTLINKRKEIEKIFKEKIENKLFNFTI